MKIFNNQTLLNLASVFIGVVFVAGSFIMDAQAQAVPGAPIPFSGTVATFEVCCNGILFTLVPGLFDTYSPAHIKNPMRLFFMLEKENIPPNPAIGLGLYQGWNLMPGNRVVGDVLEEPPGICQDMSQKCQPAEIIPPPWKVLKVGTTLY